MRGAAADDERTAPAADDERTALHADDERTAPAADDERTAPAADDERTAPPRTTNARRCRGGWRAPIVVSALRIPPRLPPDVHDAHRCL